MEQVKQDMPSKVQKCDSPLTNDPLGYMTPIQRNETSKYAAYQNKSRRFTVLPSHVTPPSGLKDFIIKNPFEPDLNKLHQSMISPTVFTKNMQSSSQHSSPGFTWTIDELAHMQPAKIEEFPIQQASPDPEIEVKAQAAIDRFFQQNQIIPSPWDIKQKNESCLSMTTPNRPLELNSTKELKSKKDVWSQTILSLPVALPQNVEEVLKPYFTFNQDQNIDNDDANSSNNSLRRKLFSNYECIDDDNDSIKSLSPVKMSESMILCHSPPQSAMFVHGTPLKRLPQARRQSIASSTVKTEDLSSPDISPIRNVKADLSYKRNKRRCSPIRMDFTMDISMDSVIEKSSIGNNDYRLIDENRINCTEGNQDNHKLIIDNNETNLCDSVNMEASSKCADTVDPYNIWNDKSCYDAINPNIMTEIGNSMFESHKQNNTIFETLDQQSTSNSVQDTGYQTCSMSNTMYTIENYSNISMSHKTHSNEQIIKDNAQLSWKENEKNIFSSTPSKCNKQDES